jgi:hypothetical protein
MEVRKSLLLGAMLSSGLAGGRMPDAPADVLDPIPVSATAQIVVAQNANVAIRPPPRQCINPPSTLVPEVQDKDRDADI